MALKKDLSGPKKMFYVHETAKTGLLLQKHGKDIDGSPFESEEAARQWVDQKLAQGGCFFTEQEWALK